MSASDLRAAPNLKFFVHHQGRLHMFLWRLGLAALAPRGILWVLLRKWPTVGRKRGRAGHAAHLLRIPIRREPGIWTRWTSPFTGRACTYALVNSKDGILDILLHLGGQGAALKLMP